VGDKRITKFREGRDAGEEGRERCLRPRGEGIKEGGVVGGRENVELKPKKGKKSP